MKSLKEFPIVGIIGCGPRGLAALEQLYLEASHERILFRTIVFERTPQLGAGSVYDVTQPPTNWLNVSERAVDIPPRDGIQYEEFAIPFFPTFQEWTGYDPDSTAVTETDRFPLRSVVGEYLKARFDSIADVLKRQGLLRVVQGNVSAARPKDDSIRVIVSKEECYDVDEAVLTIGHQPTEPDEQLSAWQSSFSDSRAVALFDSPYPIANILASDTIDPSSTVILRGFGLAMIDVVRALSEGLKGKFRIVDQVTRSMEYQKSGREPGLIIPFSLDGLPMAPKPMNKKLDLPFVPTDRELEGFHEDLENILHGDTVPQTTDFLIHAISPLIARIYCSPDMAAPAHNLSELEIRGLIESWLRDESFADGLILSKDLTAIEMMEAFSEMASGQRRATLDYCIGNIWRSCEPVIYQTLAFPPLSDNLIAEIVDLVERMKRYSYGPPLDSIQQLLALERAGILDFNYVHDPDIERTKNGWTIKKNGKTATAKILINCIVDAPQILKVKSDLPKSLVDGSIVEPWDDSLGIRTKKDGLVESKNKELKFPLAVLGRLTKGTLVGVDAIEACFGNSAEWWAKGLVERMRNS